MKLSEEEEALILERRRTLQIKELSEKEKKALEVKTATDKILDQIQKNPETVFYLLKDRSLEGGYLLDNSKEDISDTEGTLYIKKGTPFTIRKSPVYAGDYWYSAVTSAEHLGLVLSIRTETLGLLFTVTNE